MCSISMVSYCGSFLLLFPVSAKFVFRLRRPLAPELRWGSTGLLIDSLMVGSLSLPLPALGELMPAIL